MTEQTAAPVPSHAPVASLSYMSGFGNDFSTEALSGALPLGRNSPQRCPQPLTWRVVRGLVVQG